MFVRQEKYMAINPVTEDVAPLADLGKRLGRRIPYHTVRGWVKIGRVNAWTRSRVHLESIGMPSGESTSVEAYWRFIKALNTV